MFNGAFTQVMFIAGPHGGAVRLKPLAFKTSCESKQIYILALSYDTSTDTGVDETIRLVQKAVQSCNGKILTNITKVEGYVECMGEVISSGVMCAFPNTPGAMTL
jgi:hypothetical protein